MRSDIQSILCIIDFSTLSRSGLELGIVLAHRFNCSLLVFHAVNVAGDQICGSDYAHNKPRQHRHLIQAQTRMDRFLRSTDRAIPVVVCGEPVEELVRQSAIRRIDLIIAPSRGISGFKRFFTGTIVERLVRRISCPVLITRPKTQTGQITPGGLRHVVAAISLNDQPGILHYSAQVARLYDAHLHLVHILEAPPDMENEPYEIAQTHLENKISADLLADALGLNLQPDRVTTSVLTGTPGEAIHVYADDIKADLIVVGVRQISTLKKNLIGSTTEFLLRNSPCCILTLPVDAAFTSYSITP